VADGGNTGPAGLNVIYARRVMNVLDLIKATLACGGSAYFIYTFPTIGQVLLIGLLTLLWLSYAMKTIATLRRRSFAFRPVKRN
jgi:uncharacterized membrane protein YesL